MVEVGVNVLLGVDVEVDSGVGEAVLVSVAVAEGVLVSVAVGDKVGIAVAIDVGIESSLTIIGKKLVLSFACAAEIIVHSEESNNKSPTKVDFERRFIDFLREVLVSR